MTVFDGVGYIYIIHERVNLACVARSSARRRRHTRNLRDNHEENATISSHAGWKPRCPRTRQLFPKGPSRRITLFRLQNQEVATAILSHSIISTRQYGRRVTCGQHYLVQTSYSHPAMRMSRRPCIHASIHYHYKTHTWSILSTSTGYLACMGPSRSWRLMAAANYISPSLEPVSQSSQSSRLIPCQQLFHYRPTFSRFFGRPSIFSL